MASWRSMWVKATHCSTVSAGASLCLSARCIARLVHQAHAQKHVHRHIHCRAATMRSLVSHLRAASCMAVSHSDNLLERAQTVARVSQTQCRYFDGKVYDSQNPTRGRLILPVGTEAAKQDIFRTLQTKGFTMCYRWRPVHRGDAAWITPESVGLHHRADRKLPHHCYEAALLMTFDYPANRTLNGGYQLDFPVTASYLRELLGTRREQMAVEQEPRRWLREYPCA